MVLCSPNFKAFTHESCRSPCFLLEQIWALIESSVWDGVMVEFHLGVALKCIDLCTLAAELGLVTLVTLVTLVAPRNLNLLC